MKKITLLTNILLLTCLGNSQKPRYFTNRPLLCPFDYTSILSKDGLASNTTSIEIIKTPTKELVKGLKDNNGNDVANIYRDVEKADTFFKVSKVANQHYAFDVIQQIGTYSVIKYWKDVSQEKYNKSLSFYESLSKLDFSKTNLSAIIQPKKGNYNLNGVKDVNDTKGYYLIKTDELEKSSKEFENKTNKWSLGLLILPVKIRAWADTSGQFEYSDGFSLGTAFSWTFKYQWANDKSYNLVAYTGISSINVDSLKTKGATKTEKIAAFSPAVGIMIEKSGIQVGAFIGIDFPIGDIQRDWVYRNKPWIGIGLGFSIFKYTNNDNKSEAGKN